MSDSTLKTCTKCKETKAVELFPNYPKSDLPRARCIQCARDYAKEYGANNRVKRTEQSRLRRWKKRGLTGPPEKLPEPTIRICSKCKTEKAIELFPLNRRNGRHRSECKACGLARGNAWRDANKDRANAQNRQRRKGDKQRAQAAARQKRYKVNHPDKVCANKQKWNAGRKERNAQRKAEIEAGSGSDDGIFFTTKNVGPSQGNAK